MILEVSAVVRSLTLQSEPFVFSMNKLAALAGNMSNHSAFCRRAGLDWGLVKRLRRRCGHWLLGTSLYRCVRKHHSSANIR